MYFRFLFVFILFVASGAKGANTLVHSIPFELHYHKIFIDIELNDSTHLSALFDIGTSMYIHSGTAQKYNLQYDGYGQMASFSGNKETNTISLLKLKIANDSFVFENVRSQAAPYYENRRVDFVFGKEWIDNYVVEVDYNSSHIKLYDPENYIAPDNFVKNKAIAWINYPLVKATFTLDNNKKVELNTELNIAVEIGFKMDKYISKELKLAKVQKTMGKATIVGADGRAIYGVITRLQSVNLCGFEQSRVRGAYFADGYSTGKGEFVQAMLGQPFLKKYNIIFDSQRKMVYLQEKQSEFDD